MKKYPCLLIACFLLMQAFLPAQTAVEIEEMLTKDKLSYEQVVSFVLRAADVSDPSGQRSVSVPQEAFSFAAEKNWLPADALPAGEARLDGVSLLIMQSFGLKGGILYSLFRNPHYAYRELVYQKVIQGRADPEMAVSGSQLLFLLGRILSRFEEEAVYTIAEYQEPPRAEESQETESEESEQERARREAEQRALAAEINSRLEIQKIADTSARITEAGVTISLSNIQFMANSADLPESEKQKLREIVNILESVPRRNILVTGHTALAGSPEDRLRTSQERAQAVSAFLVLLGARKPNEVFYQGYGAERPIADNNTPQGMALNRRVEITILEDQR